MTAGVKLAIGTTIVAGVTAYMAYVGASAGWKYYLTADECASSAAELAGQPVRVSGTVAAHSLKITANRRQARFFLRGDRRQLPVVCQGPFPDNLAEGMEVVVEGRLEPTGMLRGDRLLTRCASKYEPAKPQAAAAGDGALAGREAP